MNGRLRIRVEELQEVQGRYAFGQVNPSPELEGAMDFARTDIEAIWLLHIAVTESAPNDLTWYIIAKLREIAG